MNPVSLQVKAKNDTPMPNMYAIGELTRGACFATTDMWQVNAQARRVSYQISNQIQRRAPTSFDNYNKPLIFSPNRTIHYLKKSKTHCRAQKVQTNLFQQVNKSLPKSLKAVGSLTSVIATSLFTMSK